MKLKKKISTLYIYQTAFLQSCYGNELKFMKFQSTTLEFNFIPDKNLKILNFDTVHLFRFLM